MVRIKEEGTEVGAKEEDKDDRIVFNDRDLEEPNLPTSIDVDVDVCVFCIHLRYIIDQEVLTYH